jgi:hypothetical protein
MAYCPSIFHWVSQSQLMPVWEEYPPPCTAYEAYYLELDQLRYMNKLGDHNQVKSTEDCAVYPFLEVNQYRDYDSSVSPQTPQHEPYQQPTSIYKTIPKNLNESEEETETISQSPGKQSPSFPETRKFPELNTNFPQISFPLENTSSLEQSSEISLEENKEESEIDVSDDEQETPFPGTGKKRSGAIFPDRDADSADSSKKEEDDEEISQPKKRQRTTPEQLEVLEKIYEKEKLPGSDLRKELALKLKMTPRRVQVWFQNKRAKEKRMGICK